MKLKDYKVSVFRVGGTVLEDCSIDRAVKTWTAKKDKAGADVEFTAIFPLKRRQSVDTYVGMLDRYLTNHAESLKSYLAVTQSANYVLLKSDYTEDNGLIELKIIKAEE